MDGRCHWCDRLRLWSDYCRPVSFNYQLRASAGFVNKRLTVLNPLVFWLHQAVSGTGGQCHGLLWYGCHEVGTDTLSSRMLKWKQVPMSKVYSRIGTEGEFSNIVSDCRIWFLKQSIHSSHIPIIHIFREDYPFKWCLQFHRCIELVVWILFWSPRCRIDIEWFSDRRNKLHSCVTAAHRMPPGRFLELTSPKQA